MKRVRIAAILTASLAAAASPVSAERKPVDSWGRAGVSFENYREDAIECATIGYYADVSETEQAKQFVRASKRLEATDDYSLGPPGASAADDMTRMVNQAAMSDRIVQSIRPERKMKELHSGMLYLVEQCLVERGYSQFRLTEEQQEQLRDLKKGSDERHRFLHSLASDPSILADQAVSASG
ncbi:MAG TPA: hypothetical protein VLA37_10900 [Sphingomonadaceae bacterium]|nr:hypothetical protein [Sphingomonadaceae bacterium]